MVSSKALTDVLHVPYPYLTIRYDRRDMLFPVMIWGSAQSSLIQAKSLGKRDETMRAIVFLLVFSLALPALAAETDTVAKAREILNLYLETPIPAGPSKTDPYNPKADAEVNGARLAREAILEQLKTMPREAVLAAGPVLFEKATPQQRYEIVEALGRHIHTRECADLLYRVIQDVREPKDEEDGTYGELARTSAVHGLRAMSKRADRPGGKRVQRGPEAEPKVRGLAPYLISAANDKSENVRFAALFALADSRDPLAVAELKNQLKGKNEKIRLYAACFLTEYQDGSGLPEMRKALNRLREKDNTWVEMTLGSLGMTEKSLGNMPRKALSSLKGKNPKDAFDYYWQVEILLASFERITGKSLGKIPLNPLLSSSSDGAENAKKQYKELLDAWVVWWKQQPAASPGAK